eukprot:TRINITY_DN5485_c0_g1_i1.p1 TRINITY_DN5485_c0_g1~~TRINITY_DN5485_c0_g1_i1.p1  ORF type:complete len:107 (+),score=12.91 TRINITY_DN5485_c0_g1_i1:94-414(+)
MRKCGAPRPGSKQSTNSGQTPSNESKESVESQNTRMSPQPLHSTRKPSHSHHSTASMGHSQVMESSQLPHMARQPGAPDPSAMVLVPTQAATIDDRNPPYFLSLRR